MFVVMLAAVLALTSVPDGGCVMVNGLMGEGEWDNSLAMELDTTTVMHVHKNAEYLFLAIEFLGPRHTGIDLFIESDGRTRMLHVSSALGEKSLENGQWSDYSWGRNTLWTANVIGSIYEDGKTIFLEPEAFEFQIDRRELGSDGALFLRLKRPGKVLPEGAGETSHDSWIQLRLE